MTEEAGSSWKDAEVARKYLDERQRAIPLGGEQVDMLVRLARRFTPQAARVADLGCGDGFLARAVLSEFPAAHALLIDHSEPMLRRAGEAMRPFSGRFEARQGDLSEPLPPQLDGPFDLIVSGFAIHHLPTARKRSLYGEVFGMLAPGGLFINVEHVASATPELEAVHDRAYIDHIAAVTGRDRAEVGREYHGRPDKADNILDPVEAQVGWLREIGFAHADCYLKWLELAVFGGVRPASGALKDSHDETGERMSRPDPPQSLGPDPIAAAMRDDGSLSIAGLISAYDASPKQLRDVVASLMPEQLRARPVEGCWSTLEVACHLADCEQFFADRMKRTIAADRPLLLGAEGSRYPGPLRYHDRDVEEEIDLIALTRRQMVRILRLLPEESWGRTAVHSETGLVTLRQLVLHAVRHQDHHLRFVVEKQRALGLPEPEGAVR